MIVPHGTRYLLVTCGAPDDAQFRGVDRASRLLASSRAVRRVGRRDGEPLRLARRRALCWVAVSGHGAADEARVSDGRGSCLRPQELRLAPRVQLYLLACHQGRESIRRAWAALTGAEVHGCEGETESGLSTLFLLALLEHGPESAAHWFERWREANNRLRPHFAFMRQTYEAHGRRLVASLEAIAALVDLRDFSDIVAVARRHARILDGLG